MRSSRQSSGWKQINRQRWQPVRRLALERDGYRCQAVGCGKAGRLEVDHVVPLHRAPAQDPYDLAGLRTLCVGCHAAKSRRENPRRRPVSAERKAWAAFMADLK